MRGRKSGKASLWYELRYDLRHYGLRGTLRNLRTFLRYRLGIVG